MQKKRGITISMLAILVVITVIITSTIIISVKNVKDNASIRIFATEFAMISDEINQIQKKGTQLNYIQDAIQMDVSGVSEDILEKQFKDENIVNNILIVYKIDLGTIGLNNTNYGKQKTERDVFVLSKKTGKVYYLEGVKAKGTTYYTYTNDLKYMAEANYKIENPNSQVIFRPSEILWTSKAIKTEVIIPKEFSNIVITTDVLASNTENISELTLIDDKYIAVVNVGEIKTNYNITVTYEKNGESISEKFEVKNYDGTAPTIYSGEQTYTVSGYDLKSYINGVRAEDALSGIEKVKYEKDKVSKESAREYFKDNGKMLNTSNVLMDNDAINYTIYAEDKAGNIMLQYINVSDKIISARTINGFNIAKGVNEPLLLEGMTPIVYDADSLTGDCWRNATDEEIKYGTWYNYTKEDKRWANARTPDGSLWVWIPRFEYDILEEPKTLDKTQYGHINVRFIPKTINKNTTGYTVNSNGIITSQDGYIIHPSFVDETSVAFYNGGWDKELTGIWVAKFETSMITNGTNTTTSTINLGNVRSSEEIKAVSKAGTTQWRYINAANAYYNSLDYTKYTAGLSTDYASHLIKNSEWGAMAYLSHSEYGYGIQNIVRNSDSTYHTGGSSELSNIYGVNRNQTTTGNAYGIYDTTGGVFERVAIFNTDYKGSSTVDYFAGSSSLSEDGKHYASTGGKSTRYATAYNSGTSNVPTEINSRIGDATYEVSANTGGFCWGNSICQGTTSNIVFLNRGGVVTIAGAKILDQRNHNGTAMPTGGYRIVLAEN